ncbi:MAG: hypothetical protein Q9227_007976 [Pyrenula ochraceoflavens]
MADSTPATTNTPTSPRASRNKRGGRGRGGVAGSLHSARGQRDGNIRVGRRGAKGRGVASRANLPQFHDHGGGLRPPAGTFGARLTEDASNAEGAITTSNAVPEVAVEDDQDGEVCFICASKVEHLSVAPCNHQSCHICALRWRALFKDRKCVHCRTEADFVIFTDDSSKRFEDFQESDFFKSDENLGIKFEKESIRHDTFFLLRYNCPAPDCAQVCVGWPHLHRHVKDEHRRALCDLCTRNRKAFTHEHQLFTVGELRKHERYGDDNPGAIDQSGFKGHPECGFCKERFYGEDELYAHCRDKHEKCHICDRRNGGRQPDYYLNYDMLEKHFKNDHFLCLDQDCLAKKFVVFESEMDLKAHQLQEHPNGLTKDARRDARLVDMSGFDYRAPYQPQRGRGGRGPGGRGRDPNAEPLPASSAQPMSRAELAYQRTMAIQSAQSVSTRTFGGQLTQSTHPSQAVRRNRSTSPPRPPPIENLSLDTITPASTVNLTPQEQARHLRHTSVIERASRLLNNDAQKLSDFRTKVSSYRTSAISASVLVDSFFSLFDTNSTELGKLVKELADIYEDKSKSEGLLKAWNDWRAINEDYPSLPGASETLPGMTLNNTNSGGKRVLKLKSSTAQSSRSMGSRQGSWGNALSSTTSNTAGSRQSPAFPPLAGAQKKQNAPMWVASSNTSASRSSPAPSRPSSTKPTAVTKQDGEAFPALPAGSKPNTLMAGLTRGNIRWDDKSKQAISTNPWGTVNVGAGGATGQPAAEAAMNSEVMDGTETGKKKGKKGKGQVLYHFG